VFVIRIAKGLKFVVEVVGVHRLIVIGIKVHGFAINKIWVHTRCIGLQSSKLGCPKGCYSMKLGELKVLTFEAAVSISSIFHDSEAFHLFIEN
jgi:hypothetical protein